MARERTLKITILGDATSARRALQGTAQGTTTLTGKMSSGISKFQAYAAGFAVVGTAAVAAGKYILDAANEQQAVAAQTEAVLKSTGEAAGVTAEEIANLAGQIRDYSGQSDEAVQKAENILLTFTKVHNQAGRGNKIFNRATKAIVDMSVALEKDLSSSAIQVGKALNMPTRGVTALTRSGVQFSEKQKELIARLEETGQVAEAQRIILKELRKEFGGSARAAGNTFAGKLNILKEKFGDVAEQIGIKVLPHLERFADWILAHQKDIVKIAGVIGKVLGGAFKLVSIYLKYVLWQVTTLIKGLEKIASMREAAGDFLQGNLMDNPQVQQLIQQAEGQRAANQVGPNAGVSTAPDPKGGTLPRMTTIVNIDGRTVKRQDTRRAILLGN